jgi:4'-phosphopantetheinyl transferase
LILGQYLDREPGSIRFVYGAHGKPSLEGADADVQFNLSHTRGLALVAIAHRRPIGVDVEQVRPFEEVAQLPRRIFSTRELSEFERLPAVDRQVAFFNAWTRKEALVKATGLGFTMNVQQVEVTFSPGMVAELLAWPPGPTTNWTLRSVVVPAGYAAALAVAGPVREIAVANWRR